MSRIRTKVCGLTRADDASRAAALGFDAIGLVFYPPSSRALDIDGALEVLRGVPAFVTVTALFLNSARAEVEHVLSRVPIDLLQFHGSESASFCTSFGKPYIKALAMGGEGTDVATAARAHANARGLLLDAHAQGEAGGQGKTFNWQQVPADRPIILAGGLTPGNVARAIATVQPWAVDVSSGVESQPGVKDAHKMAEFIDEVNRGSE